MRTSVWLLPAVALLVAADAAQEAVKKDLEQLQGEWSMVSGESNGQEFADQVFKTAKRVCKGNETTVTVGERLILKATITINPSKEPKNIDYDVREGDTKGRIIRGIYELDGDTVKFCFSAPGGERPTDFTAKAGSNRTLSTWKRTKK
jgi:uncharacterized protein (TIGR03067 family)